MPEQYVLTADDVKQLRELLAWWKATKDKVDAIIPQWAHDPQQRVCVANANREISEAAKKGFHG